MKDTMEKGLKMKIKINHRKLQKDKTIIARTWRKYNSIKHNIFIHPIHRFKTKYWHRLINKIQMIGLSKEDKITILTMRQCNHKLKCICNSTGIERKKVMAVLFYYYAVKKGRSWEYYYLKQI